VRAIGGNGFGVATRASVPAAGAAVLVNVESPRLAISASHKIDDLKPISAMDAKQYTYRIPGRADGWGSIESTDDRVRTAQNKEWVIGVPVGDAIASLPAANGKMPTTDQLVAGIYTKRTNAAGFRDIDLK